ncbi:hypothetical protein Scep_006093 [Stephania cephalantha]|uniref:Uncharacterized protein n=1 Tax=Stephania cephalantha TaxID=152367 RepID=A0AAP0K7G8_9MAGN
MSKAARKSAGDGRREERLAPGDGGAVEAGKRRRQEALSMQASEDGGEATRDRTGRDVATEKEKEKAVVEAEKAAVEAREERRAVERRGGEGAEQTRVFSKAGDFVEIGIASGDAAAGDDGWCNERRLAIGEARTRPSRPVGVQGLVQRQQADRWRTRGGLAALCLAQP